LSSSIDKQLTLVDVRRIGFLSGALSLLLLPISSRSGLLGSPFNIESKTRSTTHPSMFNTMMTHFFAPLAPSVDFAGALPAVEAGPFEATVEAGFGGIVIKTRQVTGLKRV